MGSLGSVVFEQNQVQHSHRVLFAYCNLVGSSLEALPVKIKVVFRLRENSLMIYRRTKAKTVLEV